jgi:tetratricopeptide (TPR) repeat protein
VAAGVAADLHAVAERARIVLAAEGENPDRLTAIAADGRDWWGKRETISADLAEVQSDWRADLLDIGLLNADLTVRLAQPAEKAKAREAALAVLAEAERYFGPSAAIELERARHARAAGLLDVAADAGNRARELPVSRAWEAVLAGRAHLAADEPNAALTFLNHAVLEAPRSLWAHHYRGTCLLRLGRPVEAAADFSACVALAPTAGWCCYNRGLAFLAADRFDAADADFDRCLELDPTLTVAGRGKLDVQRRRTSAPRK